MPKPWEKYASTEASGPWEKYAATNDPLSDVSFDYQPPQGTKVGNGLTEQARFKTPRNDSEQAMQTLLSPVSAPVAALKNAKGPIPLRPFEAVGSMIIDPQKAEFDKGRPILGAIPVVGPMVGATIDAVRDHEYTAAALNGIGALAAAHGATPVVSRGVAALPSPRGVLVNRMAEVPVGEQFSRGEVLNAAQEHGVNLDVAQATDSPLAAGVKRANRYSLAAQSSYENAKTSNLAALQGWAEQEAANYAKNGSSREVVGGQMQQALKSHLEARKNLASKGFTELDKSVSADFDAGGLQEAAQKIIDENKDYYAEHPELKPNKAWAILEDLARGKTKEVAGKSEFVDASGRPIPGPKTRVAIPKTMGYGELHQLRSDLMDFYRNNPDIVKGRADAWIQQMVAKADETITKAGNGLSGEQLAKFRELNGVWESIKNTYDKPGSPYYQAVRSTTPSDIPGKFVNKPEVARQVQSMLDSLDESGTAKGEFQRQFVDTLLNGKDGATLDLNGLNARLSRIPNDVLESMLGAKGARSLRMLGKVSAKVGADLNPSKTATISVPAAEVTGAFQNPIAGGAELATQYGVGKAMNSQRVVNYLTKPKPKR